jgi:uncharacterized protein YuzE
MKITYFADTDTLYIRLRDVAAAEKRDLDEDTLIDVDGAGQLCSITIEHASVRAGIPEFATEGLVA